MEADRQDIVQRVSLKSLIVCMVLSFSCHAHRVLNTALSRLFSLRTSGLKESSRK